jgi:hypothetical protein
LLLPAGSFERETTTNHHPPILSQYVQLTPIIEIQESLLSQDTITISSLYEKEDMKLVS